MAVKSFVVKQLTSSFCHSFQNSYFLDSSLRPMLQNFYGRNLCIVVSKLVCSTIADISSLV